ncbi:hypothetical protein [Saccharopolyspora hordei]|uniref:Uncharacterized protein n=1 Tax=Saccharopolyspora hordei TaxID=1838 RepID=A0A853AT61_9PSEU|nr:hypothetical protein [Saccharopolyspora hordei]NYI85841.1 hypothetical protein [Saccharopolyspora hordei]
MDSFLITLLAIAVPTGGLNLYRTLRQHGWRGGWRFAGSLVSSALLGILVAYATTLIWVLLLAAVLSLP